MMDMNGMMDRCIDAMGSMMGGSVMGNGITLVVLLAILLVWLVGLGVVGALIFWGVRRLQAARIAMSGGEERSMLKSRP